MCVLRRGSVVLYNTADICSVQTSCVSHFTDTVVHNRYYLPHVLWPQHQKPYSDPTPTPNCGPNTKKSYNNHPRYAYKNWSWWCSADWPWGRVCTPITHRQNKRICTPETNRSLSQSKHIFVTYQNPGIQKYIPRTGPLRIVLVIC